MYLSRLERAPHEVKAELTSIQFQWGMRGSCQKARAGDGIRDGAASPPRGELEQRARVLKEQERRAESTQQWVDLARRRYERTEAETRELELNRESFGATFVMVFGRSWVRRLLLSGFTTAGRTGVPLPVAASGFDPTPDGHVPNGHLGTGSLVHRS